MPSHVRKGDTVMVTAGSDRGRTGTILKVIPKSQRVIVQGLNTRTKHVHPTQTNPQGGIITKEMPIHISNVSPVADGRATRVRFVKKDDGSKVRIAARNGAELGTIHAPRKASSAPSSAPSKTRKKKASSASGKKKQSGSAPPASGGKTKKTASRQSPGKKSKV